MANADDNARQNDFAEPRAEARYQPLVVVAAALAGGIVLDRYWPAPATVWWTAAAVGWVAWLVLWRRKLDRAAAALILLCAAAIGGAGHHYHWSLYDADELGRSARCTPEPICLEAVAVTGPRLIPAPPYDPMRIIPQGDRTRLALRVVRVRDAAAWQRASGNVELLVDGHLLGAGAGDRLRVFGQLSRPVPPRNPGEFDFAAYQRADRRLCRVTTAYPDCVSVVAPSASFNPRRVLETIRSRCNALLWKNLSRERAGLAAAVLLGAREQLDRDRREAFFQTGAVHLLAISGLHLGMLTCLFFLAIRIGLVPRRPTLVAVIVLTILYALLTDARPPVVRATILVVIASVAWLLYRRPLAMNTLAAAGIVVLALNPADLFRTGPQLSFLAVATLVWIGPRLFRRPEQDALARLIARTRPWPTRAGKAVGRWAKGLLAVSAAIWLVTLPLVMYRLHLVSPVGVLVTTVVWVPMLLALNFGFGVLVFGWLAPPLGHVFGRACDASLSLVELVVQIGRRLPGSHFWVAGPPAWWVVGFYGGLAVFWALPRRRPPRRWCAALLAAWIAAGVAGPMLHRAAERPDESPRLDCTFLSVGHGTAVVVELPGGETLLYDAGSLASPTAAVRSISAFLWSRGIMHLDAVVLSHADADHYNALPDLLERFGVGVVYVSPVMFENPSPSLDALLQSIRDSGVPVRTIYGGDRLRTSGPATIEVLHPPRRGVLGGDNANSIVLSVEHAGRRILLPGDIESPGLEDVLAELPRHADVVMAPHHGSLRSNPAGFSAWCTPGWVVISGGRSPSYAAVESAFRSGGARVLHTGYGAVRARIDAAGVTVGRYARGSWHTPPGGTMQFSGRRHVGHIGN